MTGFLALAGHALGPLTVTHGLGSPGVLLPIPVPPAVVVPPTPRPLFLEAGAHPTLVVTPRAPDEPLAVRVHVEPEEPIPESPKMDVRSSSKLSVPATTSTFSHAGEVKKTPELKFSITAKKPRAPKK